jgi:hypothetical protein
VNPNRVSGFREKREIRHRIRDFMFTGLVQALGTVRDVTDVRGGRRLRVAEPVLAP